MLKQQILAQFFLYLKPRAHGLSAILSNDGLPTKGSTMKSEMVLWHETRQALTL